MGVAGRQARAMTQAPHAADQALKNAVTEELRCTPRINSAGIGVSVTAGTVKPRAHASDIKAAINAALLRSAQLGHRTIGVTTDSSGGVVLRGPVGSWAEHRQAEHVSWAAPGITSVDNQLHVIY
jgi:osmotically-inducible protein OsmY